jgi:hypothetical protein
MSSAGNHIDTFAAGWISPHRPHLLSIIIAPALIYVFVKLIKNSGLSECQACVVFLLTRKGK